MTELTVVIPTHGKRPLLEATLAALARQELDPGLWNVVVVDDASPDDTADYLEREAGGWGGRLLAVAPAGNLGRSAARNFGARHADGRWLLFLDDDIVAPPGLLGAHLELLRRHPDDGVIGQVRTARSLVDAPHFGYIDSRGVAKCGPGPVPPRYLVTQNTSLPRAAFEAVGGFDEDFTGYGFEDMDLGCRLAAIGTGFRALPDPVPEHVHHHTFDEWLHKKRQCGHGPLQRVAAVHPDRLEELRLHWILDPPGVSPGAGRRVARSVLRSFRPLLHGLLARWPARGDGTALAFPIYARFLDLLILATFCQGLSEADSLGHPG